MFEFSRPFCIRLAFSFRFQIGRRRLSCERRFLSFGRSSRCGVSVREALLFGRRDLGGIRRGRSGGSGRLGLLDLLGRLLSLLRFGGGGRIGFGLRIRRRVSLCGFRGLGFLRGARPCRGLFRGAFVLRALRGVQDLRVHDHGVDGQRLQARRCPMGGYHCSDYQGAHQ